MVVKHILKGSSLGRLYSIKLAPSGTLGGSKYNNTSISLREKKCV